MHGEKFRRSPDGASQLSSDRLNIYFVTSEHHLDPAVVLRALQGYGW